MYEQLNKLMNHFVTSSGWVDFLENKKSAQDIAAALQPPLILNKDDIIALDTCRELANGDWGQFAACMDVYQRPGQILP